MVTRKRTSGGCFLACSLACLHDIGERDAGVTPPYAVQEPFYTYLRRGGLLELDPCVVEGLATLRKGRYSLGTSL